MTKDNKTVVETKYGKIQGILEDGMYIFKGVPYAGSTAGDARWLPPQPVNPWKGIRPAIDFGPIAPQGMDDLKVMPEFYKKETPDEDCLHLNIWSPGLDSSKRPVMVWIHGGAFNVGSGSMLMYSGKNLARRGNLVVISINYRLGSLGFLHLKTITENKIPASGNEGLLDQIAALKWIRENISAFGGDPENVTIFGESAGAMSVGCLLAIPQSRGLFHKAILQSGANTVISLDRAKQLADQFVGILDAQASNFTNLLSLPIEKVISAQLELSVRTGIKGALLKPVVDGEVLPDLPIEAVRKGSASQVKIMAGTNLDEVKLFARAGANPAKLDETGLLKRFQRFLPPELVPALIERYRSARSTSGASTDPLEMFAAIHSDLQFRIPALRLLDAQDEYQPTYNYLFTLRSPLPGLGACHALDIGFVFGNLSPSFNGSGPAVEKLAAQMQDAWSAFARNGNPSCDSLGNWPAYGKSRRTMILGEECHMMEAPYEEERQAWDSIPSRFLG